ncbi:hypothetical protein [Nocardia sp. NPDC059239]|uniref:hypothetical protein n=1 Tax=unclassified Nocardia TaxID=2637762 RepID=UPI0036874DDD
MIADSANPARAARNTRAAEGAGRMAGEGEQGSAGDDVATHHPGDQGEIGEADPPGREDHSAAPNRTLLRRRSK